MVSCEAGTADGGEDRVGHGGGDRVSRVGKLVVVVKAVILISGLVSLHGTGFSPCLGPGSAAALCDGGPCGKWT